MNVSSAFYHPRHFSLDMIRRKHSAFKQKKTNLSTCCYVRAITALSTTHLACEKREILKEIFTAEMGAPTSQTIVPLKPKGTSKTYRSFPPIHAHFNRKSYNHPCHMCQLKFQYIPYTLKNTSIG
jgi:hypothetical protein|uniref:Uncharacterized protein n=1 Tax=Zea mays TaxID=4577 RepID=A0A804NWJ0_MAIZE